MDLGSKAGKHIQIKETYDRNTKVRGHVKMMQNICAMTGFLNSVANASCINIASVSRLCAGDTPTRQSDNI